MYRIGVAVVVSLVVVCVPLVGGGASSAVDSFSQPVQFAPDVVDDVDDKQELRGPNQALVRQWIPPTPRKRKGEAGPTLAPVREILLTFDDGPDMHTTPVVLQELAKRDLKAIFFVAGRRLVASGHRGQRQRALLQQMVAQGHLIANHTIHHVHLCDRPHRIAQEVDGNDAIIKKYTGALPLLFRTPFGDRCAELDQELKKRGFVDVGWNIDPQDWRRKNPDDVANYVITKLKRLPGKGILLMHDTRKAGVKALGDILDWIAAEQHRAKQGKVRPIEIRDYRALFPDGEIPDTGIEPILGQVAANVATLPGLEALRL